MTSSCDLRLIVADAAAEVSPHEYNMLSRLIGDIYDAALDHDLWSSALEGCANFVGGVGASLFVKDTAARGGDVYHIFGIAQHYQTLYFEKYVELDPSTAAHLAAECEQPVATSDLMPYEEFTKTRFYREWVRPQSLVDFVGVALDKSASGVAMFGVFRHERDGLVDETVRRRMMLLVPHIRRAVLISRMFEATDDKAVAFSDAFDGLISGMFLIDDSGRIAHANRAGKALLAARAVLRSSGGRLVACGPQYDQLLREAITAASQGDATFGVGENGIALPLTGTSDDRYVAHIWPLRSGTSRQPNIASSAVAAVFVRKVAMSVSSSSELIGRAFRLTPAELRVLVAIVEVGGVPEVAAALGVAETTVRTHLRHLFEKTGATRQADLVKLVAGYANPLGA